MERDNVGLAAIVVSYNDDYKIKEWYDNYQFYKDAVDLLVIADNGSESAFLEKVKSYFPTAILLELGINLGSTHAYNEAIKYVIKNNLADTIMLIGNDMKIRSEDVLRMYRVLQKDTSIAMIGPVILKKDSMIIDGVGYHFNKHYAMHGFCAGEQYNENNFMEEIIETEAMAGGMNIVPCSIYRKLGMQDEKLFMYADEVDTSIRIHKKGYKIAVDTHALAWHQHINKPGRSVRSPYVPFLIDRNNTYIARKHYGIGRGMYMLSYTILSSLRIVVISGFKSEQIQNAKMRIKGALNGFRGKMTLPQGLWI
ncbi:glycosyltransferase family 2 protein [Candidatus Merdisoma sp. JLR.KK006]|uniref:glycosyltransferase family 2 protein n=1 Tax=Candidatus Merdisoma sp. JLR.KK006 TaxID=3112626 RepID=UPI002FF2C46E